MRKAVKIAKPRTASKVAAPAKLPGLKEIAEYLGLSVAAVSMALNDAPLAQTLTPKTRARIFAAAKKFNYRPNLMARSLSKRESRTIGIVAPESSDGYFTRVMRGIEEALLESGYMSFTASHQSREDLIREYPFALKQRAVDGLIFLNTKIVEAPGVPSASISNRTREPGVTNILVDQRLGTRLALQHLQRLGHRRAVFIRGQSTCLEASDRWDLMLSAARDLGMEIAPELFIEIDKNQLTPELAFEKVSRLLKSRPRFTAVCAFNDTSAIGAIRALADFGIRCPEDVSVVGFDDIGVADFYTPRLTTVRQPLEEMGRTAVKELIGRIRQPALEECATVLLKPELMVRESTRSVERADAAPRKRRALAAMA